MLSVEEKAACLKNGIFARLDDDTLTSMAQRMGEREFDDGESLFLKGEPGDEIFVVVDGEIEIHIGDYVIAVLGTGQLFGEMAVLGGGKRTASCRAKGKATLLFLKEKAIRVLIQQIPDLAFAIFSVLVERLEESNRLCQFLSGDKKLLGAVQVEGGECEGKKFPIYHEKSVLGKAKGSVAADALRIAIPVGDGCLLENHAMVSVSGGSVFIEPADGEVVVNGDRIDDIVDVVPSDIVKVGGLSLRFKARD